MTQTQQMLSSEESTTVWIAASTWLASSFALIVVAVVTVTYGVLYRVFRADDPRGAEERAEHHK
jgi:anti-sigma-K factor RskA